MLKYFYNVIYQKENIEDGSFDLGIFSTQKNAKLKVSKALACIGFTDKQCFKIIKFGVHFPNNTEKSNIKLYSVAHEYSIEEDEQVYDIFNVFDILGSKSEAEHKVEWLKKHSRIGRKFPDNFIISETIVDNFLAWSEGFTAY